MNANTRQHVAVVLCLVSTAVAVALILYGITMGVVLFVLFMVWHTIGEWTDHRKVPFTATPSQLLGIVREGGLELGKTALFINRSSMILLATSIACFIVT